LARERTCINIVVIVDRDEDRLGMKEFEMVALSGYFGHRLCASRWSEDLSLSSIIPLIRNFNASLRF
jgi:hypothetical protein